MQAESAKHRRQAVSPQLLQSPIVEPDGRVTIASFFDSIEKITMSASWCLRLMAIHLPELEFVFHPQVTNRFFRRVRSVPHRRFSSGDN